MKKIKGLMLVLSVLSITACTKNDNLSGPDSGFQGKFIDASSGGKSNIIAETNGLQVKLEELSWSATPTPQTIPSKPDGTFEDSKLFKGHYRVTPYAGAFWPVEPIELDIKGMTTHDFELTPYMHITNFAYHLDGTTLTMTFKLDPPIADNLPQLLDLKPYVNVDKYVGPAATISQYTDNNRQDLNANWSQSLADATFTLTVPNLKPGRTFFARVGVRFNDSFKSSNLSDVIQVDVP